MTLSCAVLGAGAASGERSPGAHLLPPQELPIGIITSSIGAFFVVAMVIRSRQ
jgi:iron complex transport system permease protein